MDKQAVRSAIKRAMETELAARLAEQAVVVAKANADFASKEHRRAVVELSNVMGPGSPGVLFNGSHVRVGQQGTLLVVPVLDATDVSEPVAAPVVNPPTVSVQAASKQAKADRHQKAKEVPLG